MTDTASDTVLTSDRIVDTAECVLRRFGLAKATVIDVARALDVSHGSVYRHFPSKASLHDAVADRWLTRVNAPMGEITASKLAADRKLDAWLRTFIAAKHTKVLEDPELFATYLALAQSARGVVKAHIERMVGQIASILDEGVKQGVFETSDVRGSARAIYEATSRFHHPCHADEWKDPDIQTRIDNVIALVLRGIAAPRKH